MKDKSFELLTEEELRLIEKFEACKTMEELIELEKETNTLFETSSIPPKYHEINMPIEEFKKKYDLVDIKDLKGKYGF